MGRLLSISLVAALFFVAGRLSRQVPVEAEGQGAQASPPPCKDVNGDGLANLTDPIFLLNWLFLSGPEPTCAAQGGPGAPAATGQTKCYDENGVQIDCDNADYPGQDAFYKTGCPAAGRFTDNGNGTVTDGCTGLMWQKETADTNFDGFRGDLDPLTWKNSLKFCESLILTKTGTWAAEKDIVDGKIAEGDVLYRDWRLPNVRELQTIIDFGQFNPSMDPIFGAVGLGYWTSSSTNTPDTGWFVNFQYGGMGGKLKWIGSYVRAVRNAE